MGWEISTEKWPRRTLGSLGPGSQGEKKIGQRGEPSRAVRLASLWRLTPCFASPHYGA